MAVKRRLRLEKHLERESDTAYFFSQWHGRNRLVAIPHPREITLTVPAKQQVERKSVKDKLRVLVERLCAEHPSICTDPEVLGGTPHIKGTRLSVRTILGKLYLYGSVQTVLDIYEPHLSEEQVKEAIAYAQGFLEIACDSEEPQSNG
jgi:uncharacterized protein (DUF433 family)